MPTGVKRVAAGDAARRQPAAFDGAKPANRFHRIFRAGRHEAAAWAEQGADEAFVAAQQENKEF